MCSSQVTFASYSTLFYIVLLILSILGICNKLCLKIFTSQANFLLFLIWALLVFVNIFAVEDQLVVKTYFRVATGFIIGIAFTISGAFLFFTKADDNIITIIVPLSDSSQFSGTRCGSNNDSTYHRWSFLIASTFGPAKMKDLFHSHYAWVLAISDKLTFLIQKIVQAIVYIILRHKVTSQHHRESARFYFQILSFFNFIEWVDFQVNENRQWRKAKWIQRDLWSPVWRICNVLQGADYRLPPLMCSSLHLEHSLDDQTGGNDATTRRDLTLSERKLRSLGFMIGFTSLAAPICSVLSYVSTV